ncbi:hypothetical protein PIB30_013041 [Stylosanthes scabra]|uniref:Uncharacterized protein n=1 Tax=Stylosanthes scabra TaxID=79078 RepID=A0ABU6S6I7_9FABA|nr:hypothetical protein [Stylosanthes scabra]
MGRPKKSDTKHAKKATNNEEEGSSKNSDATAVKITTSKIGDALGLCSKGTAYETRVMRKNLSQEDKDIHKFFQGKTTVELTELVQTTPLHTEENRKLFMRAFILFIQKAFLLPNSTARIVPTALTTIFDLETTSKRNWALHFGENSNEVEARAPWIAYWKGDTLKKRLKQERTHEGLLKTGEMMTKKDVSKRKNPTMRVLPSRRDSDSDSEATESNLAAEPEPEHDAHDEPPPQREIRSKKRNDRDVVGSNAPVIRTQQSVVEPGSDPLEHIAIVRAFKKRKTQEGRHNKTKQQTPHQINERDEAVQTEGGSVSEATRMFDSFDTVNLGRDESDNVAIEGPVVVPSEPPHRETEVHHEKTTDAGVDDNTGVDVPPIPKTVEGEEPQHQEPQHAEPQHEEPQPEPLAVIIDQPSKSLDADVDVPPLADDIQDATEPEPLTVVVPLQSEQQNEPERTSEEPIEEEPEPKTMNIPLELEPELTLRPWLQDEVGTSADKDPTKSADEMITDDPEAASVSMEEKCFIWATTNNDNKYETIFQLRGPNTQEAMRYNFMTMEPSSCIDMVMVSLVCHVLNREEVERYQRDVYCVPPEILTLMFETYVINHLDKKTKKLQLVTSLKDKEYMALLDREKLKTTSACNMLDQLRVWAVAPSIIKKNSNTLQLRPVDVPKQPNPTDCSST